MKATIKPIEDTETKIFPGLYKDPVNDRVWFFLEESVGILVYDSKENGIFKIGQVTQGADARYICGLSSFYTGSVTLSN